MAHARKKGIVVGAFMLSAGLAYFFLTMRIPGRGGIDATFFPYVLAVGMIILGAIHILVQGRAIVPVPAAVPSQDFVEKAKAAADDEDAPARDGAPNYFSVALSLALIALFVFAMRPLGFILAAAIYLFLQFALLSPLGRPVPWLRLALLAIAIATGVFFLFRYVFDLLLPGGLLTSILP